MEYVLCSIYTESENKSRLRLFSASAFNMYILRYDYYMYIHAFMHTYIGTYIQYVGQSGEKLSLLNAMC
jgi:hypothetical protein